MNYLILIQLFKSLIYDLLSIYLLGSINRNETVINWIDFRNDGVYFSAAPTTSKIFINFTVSLYRFHINHKPSLPATFVSYMSYFTYLHISDPN
jgi:lipoprotein signal peptidase